MTKTKFITARPFADPNTAARKLIEIANDIEAVIDRAGQRAMFLAAGGTPMTRPHGPEV
jgi:hypothetical protein